MTTSALAATLLLAAVASACQPTPQSNADTTALTTSSSTQTSIVQNPADASVRAPGSPAAGTKISQQTTTGTKSTNKVGSGTQKSTATDTSIRGWDSVIKMKMKRFPTTSSTPTK